MPGSLRCDQSVCVGVIALEVRARHAAWSTMGTLLTVAVIVLVVWFAVRQSKSRSAIRGQSADRGPTAKTIDGGTQQQIDARAAQLLTEIDAAVVRDYDRDPQRAELRRLPRASGTRDHSPPRPSGHTFEAWSPRTRQLEVAGEWYRADSLRELFRNHAGVSDAGA